MNCAEARERLDDYVDGALSEAAFQETELHLSACPECREEERLLRALLAHAAALPREVRPERDLWPGIADRIGGRHKVLAFVPRRLSPAVLAAAAAAVVAVASTVGVRVFQGTGPSGGPGPAPLATVLPAAETTAGLDEAEADYARASAALLAALEARRGSIPAETLAAVQENVRAIDTALDEVRGALRKDPGNRQLAYLLASTHQKKVDVLRRVVRLSTRL